jgi:acyl-CoA thioester hydrolase
VKRPSHAVSVDLEVPFHDVDALRIVWFGNYYKYLDVARTALFRAHDLDVDTLVATGYRFLAIESQCRHHFPLRYADRFQVAAWFLGVDHRIRVAYEVWNTTHQRRAARASMALCTVDEAGVLQVETPEPIRSRIPV